MLPSPRTHALFLDIDGTLLPIVAHPDAVRVPPDVLALLSLLHERLQGALALVSGRPISDIDRLFAPLVLPCAGVHGFVRRGADGVVREADGARQLDPLREPMADFARTRAGILVEDKRHSLALHYRGAPSREAEAETFLRQLIGAQTTPLEMKRGKMVLEVHSSSADKGTAIEAFMEEAPFAARTPVFIGDDVTDEDGFEAVNRLGGLSIHVGEGDTAAAHTLPDERAVHAWLRSWIDDEREGEAR